ncbi:amino acid/amide ABC transporter membrane protein 2, HAAT family [Halovenus aranensis]|uniref:Amino acid/amide ABC transporter membrane protein 2, HAAT family n=1 Tax=Halovenus aranensis TaxID=890420 RepID=A0A1G8X3I8_9EURY|nr:branched-chain amino acid ABC transporter permease [Halovenus aranensis]SDJ85199.1 amino acid/amide ABC transporter membrane protein 2, HAAT family [Halovenus aranensis]
MTDLTSRIEDLPGDAVHAGLIAVGAALLFLASPLFVQAPSGSLVFFEVGVLFVLYAMVLVGLNLQFGHAGLVNFGPVAFFAVGGYTAAVLTAEDPFQGVGLGLPWPVGLAAGVLAAMALGVLLGVSTLRLRDDFLAIVTLAVAEIVHGSIITFRDITGGTNGLQNVPQPVAGTTDAGGNAELVSTVLVFGAFALLFYGLFRRLSASPYGRVLRAIRADEQVTETLGKRVFRYKLVVFVYGAAVAGLAGALLVFYNGAASDTFFTIDMTVIVWVGMLIGGAGSDRGVLGGLAVIMSFQLLTRFFNDSIPFVTQDQFASIRLMLIGLLLMIIIKYRPEGIWGNADRLGVDS